MRILLVTDAWAPQVNGVVRSLEMIVDRLRAWGDEVHVLAPDSFRTLACPTYPEIALSLARPSAVKRFIGRHDPDVIHIATEGPLGWLTRRACLQMERPFTTSYHTRFPEYVAARLPLPRRLVEPPLYALMRHFHNAGCACMVATETMRRELGAHDFSNLTIWSRGVDTARFHPDQKAPLPYEAPIFLNVGRVAVEKNLPAFLSLDLPGTKIVVGDGPDRKKLEADFPDAVFLGAKHGDELARIYASADVFVFPSKTDTFGNVMLEAMSSGVPVAAFPVPGPIDVVTDPKAGVLDEDLRTAALAALRLSKHEPRAFATRHDWDASARVFQSQLAESARRPLPTATHDMRRVQPNPA